MRPSPPISLPPLGEEEAGAPRGARGRGTNRVPEEIGEARDGKGREGALDGEGMEDSGEASGWAEAPSRLLPVRPTDGTAVGPRLEDDEDCDRTRVEEEDGEYGGTADMGCRSDMPPNGSIATSPSVGCSRPPSSAVEVDTSSESPTKDDPSSLEA